MSENQPEISDKELEHLAGGKNDALRDQQAKQDVFQKHITYTDQLATINKKMSEMLGSVIRALN